MDKIKNIDPDKVDSTMSAISSVIKALISVAVCLNSFSKKGDVKGTSD